MADTKREMPPLPYKEHSDVTRWLKNLPISLPWPKGKKGLADESRIRLIQLILMWIMLAKRKTHLVCKLTSHRYDLFRWKKNVYRSWKMVRILYLVRTLAVAQVAIIVAQTSQRHVQPVVWILLRRSTFAIVHIVWRYSTSSIVISFYSTILLSTRLFSRFRRIIRVQSKYPERIRPWCRRVIPALLSHSNIILPTKRNTPISTCIIIHPSTKCLHLYRKCQLQKKSHRKFQNELRLYPSSPTIAIKACFRIPIYRLVKPNIAAVCQVYSHLVVILVQRWMPHIPHLLACLITLRVSGRGIKNLK